MINDYICVGAHRFKEAPRRKSLNEKQSWCKMLKIKKELHTGQEAYYSQGGIIHSPKNFMQFLF